MNNSFELEYTPPPVPVAQEPASGSMPSVLVVDSDGDTRAAMRIALIQEGCRVIDTASMVEAMEILEQDLDEVHLVVTDIDVPETSDAGFGEWVRWARPGVKVLYTSASEKSLPDMSQSGTTVLSKPFDNNELTGKVKELLNAPVRATILVTDDDDQLRDLFCEVLAANGYRVLEAGDGKHAMELLARERVDLMITDLMMPEQEGLETIRALRQRGTNLRIVVISGAIRDYLRIAKFLGADAVLAKPVSPSVLLEAVQSALAAERPARSC